MIIAIRDYRSARRGSGRADELAIRIAELRAALIGWQHPALQNGRTVELAGPCAVLGFKNGVVWWQDVYGINYDITQ